MFFFFKLTAKYSLQHPNDNKKKMVTFFEAFSLFEFSLFYILLTISCLKKTNLSKVFVNKNNHKIHDIQHFLLQRVQQNGEEKEKNLREYFKVR